MIFTYWW